MPTRKSIIRTTLLALVLGLLIVPYVPVGAWPLPDTGSMEPTMRGCDLLVYGPADDVEVGDVVIFDAPWRDGLVIHRIVGETSQGYVLKGDANAAPDPMLVPEKRVVAEVHHVVESGGAFEGICDPVSDAALTAFDATSDLIYP
ncbi:signal peptidase I [Halobacteriales archaeon QS_1_68_20]|nr:MAG: signal peptidase I [Halobacteriales archaeon QS_1_68_20]